MPATLRLSAAIIAAGTPLGVLGAYHHYFDEKSQASRFGATSQYTSTDAKLGGVFAKPPLV